MAVDAYVQFNGVELLNDNSIINFRVDDYSTDPIITKPGRMWYNTTQNAWKYSVLKNGALEIKYMDKALNPTGEVLPLGWKALTKTVSYNNQYIDGPIWISIDAKNGNFSFQNDKDRHIFENFVIPFDYKPGTRIYPTIHWAPASISTGNVVWEFNYNVSRGYGQGDVLNVAPMTFRLNTSGTGNLFENQTTICPYANSFPAFEPNSVVSLRLSRKGSSIEDTFVGDIYIVAISLMYQSDHESTLNNKPNFNA